MSEVWGLPLRVVLRLWVLTTLTSGLWGGHPCAAQALLIPAMAGGGRMLRTPVCTPTPFLSWARLSPAPAGLQPAACSVSTSIPAKSWGSCPQGGQAEMSSQEHRWKCSAEPSRASSCDCLPRPGSPCYPSPGPLSMTSRFLLPFGLGWKTFLGRLPVGCSPLPLGRLRARSPLTATAQQRCRGLHILVHQRSPKLELGTW